MNVALPEVRHNQQGFSAFVRLWAQTEKCFIDDINIDMHLTTWFDADMCAALGAILYRLGDSVNTINLQNIPSRVETILAKNGFLSQFGRKKIPDQWGTTIPYRRFDVKDDRYFASYIETEFIQRAEMPGMSKGLTKKFRESVFEIFSNAVLHSRTKLGIFSCGQFFPTRNRLDFSVADLGIGIRQNIIKTAGIAYPPEEAISWATEGHNTTKRGKVPGGLGLKLLKEFIDLNDGRLQIISDAGYWQREKSETTTARLKHPFPGTVVCIEINTADTKSYMLSAESSQADIF